MKFVRAVVAQAIRQGSDGRPEGVGPIRGFTSDRFPLIAPIFHIIAHMVTTEEERDGFRLGIRIVDPGGKQIGLRPEMKMTPESGSLPTMEFSPYLTVNRTRFDKPGLHQIHLSVNDHVVAVLPLDISQKAIPLNHRPPKEETKNLELSADERSVLGPPEHRFCVVEVIGDGDNRHLAVISRHDDEAEADAAIEKAFQEGLRKNRGNLYAVGLVDRIDDSHMRHAKWGFN